MAFDPTRLLILVDELSVLQDRVRAAKQTGDWLAVERELSDGYALMGVARRRLGIEAPAVVRKHLGHGDLVRALAELLAQESDLLRLEGDPDSAATSARWTLQLLLHGAPPGDYSALTRPLLALAERRPPPEPL